MPEERRELEHRLRTSELLGLASTSALELGIDISGSNPIAQISQEYCISSLWEGELY